MTQIIYVYKLFVEALFPLLTDLQFANAKGSLGVRKVPQGCATFPQAGIWGDFTMGILENRF